ncbi:protein of unknown function [Candidatus Filomicrobium marinum]|uniref:Uncharacterized protein n=1 Tax=Candidatus Filomicrobium marinum TaxID=1608628 RepID=A0A0D6JF58_9HYPH|nr:hypothetical protein [Candidatus Filomicrobium marinum]CFX24545.1 protein of unknown function [Candidatus Filomicrobium marinum]CPR19182.1 protein of unknown function [Candidatus Filomicrobium marinum]
MEFLTGEVFVAWTNEEVASGRTEEEAIERLFGDKPVKPFLTQRFVLQLPMIEAMRDGVLAVSSARPSLSVVGGSEADDS